MLNELIRRLTSDPEPDALGPEDSRLALAALMVRLARADDLYTHVEKRRIDLLLAERYGLGAERVRDLRAEAERVEAAAPDTVRFTRLVKDAVAYDDRVGVIEALWKVAAAEGVNAEERAFLRLVANLIGVTDQDSGMARQRVLKDDAG